MKTRLYVIIIFIIIASYSRSRDRAQSCACLNRFMHFPLMRMTLCAACGASIHDKKNRCSLSANVLLVTLSQVAAGLGNDGTGVHIHTSGYVCKKCKLKLQRLHRLKKQTTELQQKSIMTTLPSNIPKHSAEVGNSAQSTTPTTQPAMPTASPRCRKRSSEKTGSKSPKRQRLNLR